MKKPVLVLLALLSLIAFAQSMAQTPPPAPVPTAQFLAALAGGQAQAPKDLAPAPSFMTGCPTSPCPTGQLCCNVCGNPPAEGGVNCLACVTPIRGRCPLIS
jgi:hypothetical protein